MVAYVSSANSRKTATNAGLMPEAFQEALNVLLKAPAGVFGHIGLVIAKNRTHTICGIVQIHVKPVCGRTWD